MKVDCFDATDSSIVLRESHRDAHTPSRDIDGVFETLAQEAASDLPASQFHERLLAAAIRETGATGAAIWLGGECIAERLPARLAAEGPGSAVMQSRSQLVERVVHLGQPSAVPLECSNSTAIESQFLVAMAPVSVEKPAEGAIELIFPGSARQGVRQHASSLAVAFAEVLAEFHRRGRLEHYRQHERHWKTALQFIERVHRSGLPETAVAIVNEGRWFVGCDRLSVLAARDGRCELLAVSGIDQVEKRTSVSRRMCELAEAVVRVNEPLWATGEPQAHAPQVEQTLQALLDESKTSAAVVLPLPKPAANHPDSDSTQTDERDGQVNGVLVLEWFAMPTIDPAVRERIGIAARHAAAALAVAQATDDLPLIQINRALGKLRWLVAARQLPKTLWLLGSLALVILALVVVPADLEVAADGELLPAERREIFAPADGVVDAVLVEHGDDVVLGQPLLRLRSPALDLEKARLEGEIQTAEKRLAAIQAARFERDSQTESADLRHLRLTAEEEELKLKLHSLRQQDQLLAAQQAELEIRAPFAGRVLTWDAARSLKARPVKRGQQLLTIGDVAGRWQVELQVPERHIGYVLQSHAGRHGEQPLPVSFLLLANPEVLCRGQVERIALRSCVDEPRGDAFVRVTVRLDEPLASPRPGAGVAGKIRCGERSLGFVWLHDAWNSIQRRVLF